MRKLIFKTVGAILIIVVVVYFSSRIKAYHYLKSDTFYEELDELTDYLFWYKTALMHHPPTDPIIYERIQDSLGTELWPILLQKLSEYGMEYLPNDTLGNVLSVQTFPKILSNDREYILVDDITLSDALFFQGNIIINNYPLDSAIFPNRYSELFLTIGDFPVVNQKLQKDINRDLKLYADLLIYKGIVVNDIPNYFKFEITQNNAVKPNIINGDFSFFKSNEFIMCDLRSIFNYYKNELKSYSKIYFDLRLYPSRMPTLTDSEIIKRVSFNEAYLKNKFDIYID